MQKKSAHVAAASITIASKDHPPPQNSGEKRHIVKASWHPSKAHLCEKIRKKPVLHSS